VYFFIGFDFAFIMFGSVAYLGWFSLRSVLQQEQTTNYETYSITPMILTVLIANRCKKVRQKIKSVIDYIMHYGMIHHAWQFVYSILKNNVTLTLLLLVSSNWVSRYHRQPLCPL
jgi:hypothetical protein